MVKEPQPASTLTGVLATRLNAQGTPNFFINGRNFRGAQPVEAFRHWL